jgi:CheY-like chemotaxis protein
LERKLILIVDDDDALRALVSRSLSPLYDTREAVDGIAAIDALAELPCPSLIILDVMMPRSDGLAFAATVKADRRFRGIPIVFLSSKSSSSDVIRGINAGARSYLSKPFTIAQLRETVARALPH